jgi:hypothetical protein
MAGGPGRRGERAMATDSMGPLRDETREERAAAGRTGAGDTPRE